MAFFRFGLSVLALVCLVPACSSSGPGDANEDTVPGGEEIVRTESYSPFPEVASVRLFSQTDPFDEATIEGLVDPKGRLLTAQQQQVFVRTFKKKTIIRAPTGGYMATACAFVPRHVFRFYDKFNRRVGDALVCFDCYDLEFSPADKLATNPFPKVGETVLDIDFVLLEDLLAEMQVPTYRLES